MKVGKMLSLKLLLVAGLLYQCASASNFLQQCKKDGTIDIGGTIFNDLGDYMQYFTRSLVNATDRVINIAVNRFKIRDKPRIQRLRGVLNTCYASCRSCVTTVTVELDTCKNDVQRTLAAFESSSRGGTCTYTEKRSFSLLDLKGIKVVTDILALDFLLKINVLTTITGVLNAVLELAGGILTTVFGTTEALLNALLSERGIFGGGLLGGILGGPLSILRPTLGNLKGLVTCIAQTVIAVVIDLETALFRHLDGILNDILGINLFVIECNVRDSGRRVELCNRLNGIIGRCVTKFKVTLNTYNRCIDSKYHAFARARNYDQLLQVCRS